MTGDEPVGPIGEIEARRKTAILPAFMSESKTADPTPPTDKPRSGLFPPEEENLLVIFAPVINAMSRFFRFVSRFLFWSIVVAFGIQLQFEYQAWRIRVAMEDAVQKIKATVPKK